MAAEVEVEAEVAAEVEAEAAVEAHFSSFACWVLSLRNLLMQMVKNR